MTTINQPISCLAFRKDSKSAMTPLLAKKDASLYAYSHPESSCKNVKEALDELFSLTVPPGPEYKLFYLNIAPTLNTTFIVPNGVTELLVLIINGGNNASSNTPGTGGQAWSFYATVDPGQELKVKLYSSSSSGGYPSNATAFFAGYGERDKIIPEENRLFNSKAGNGSSNGSTPGAGGGGFWVVGNNNINLPQYQDAIAEKWREVALTNTPDGAPTNASGPTPGKGWPDTTHTGGTASSTIGGSGASYGGGGGAKGTSGAFSIGRGGGPFIAVFWGKKIHPEGGPTPPPIILNEVSPNVYQP